MKDMNGKDGFVSDEEMDNMSMNADDNTNETLADSDTLSAGLDIQEKYNELNNSYLRLHAEFDNYRKRTLKEKTDLIKTAGEKVIVDLLPILDDFERALENINTAVDADNTKKGVELIYNKFVDFLLRNGVKKMEVIGQPFDMDKHEALTTINAESEDMKGKIVDCVQPGYEMNEKVIRFPKVIVAK